MNTIAATVTAIFLGLASNPTFAGEYDFKPGLWETTMTMEIKGIPAQLAEMMKMPTQTRQECVQESDLMFKTDDECKFNRKRISANKMLVTIACKTPEGITKGAGEINFYGDKSTGWFEMNVPQGPAGPMTMKSLYQAKYLGACK